MIQHASLPTIENALGPDIGVRHALSYGAYSDIKAVNWHSIEPYRVSPKHARHAALMPRDASDSMVFGEAFHCAVLEPERFKVQYITRPKFDGHPNSNAYKQAKQAWEFNNTDKVHLSIDEYAELHAMQQSVRSHPIASGILAGKGRNELSMVWEDQDTKAICKGRVDRFCRVKIGLIDPNASKPDADALVLVDFKTCRSVDPRGFDRARAEYQYNAQMAFYLDGLMALQPGVSIVPLIVAIENKAPFDCVVYRIDDEGIENGRMLYRRLLRMHLRCVDERRWPGIAEKYVVPLGISGWEKEKSE
jgi:exodeoxyribonuclease VIII